MGNGLSILTFFIALVSHRSLLRKKGSPGIINLILQTQTLRQPVVMEMATKVTLRSPESRRRGSRHLVPCDLGNTFNSTGRTLVLLSFNMEIRQSKILSDGRSCDLYE